ncbi:MAG: hypothetical protein ABI978_05830, partial [Chloroflexota bacterium]
VLWAAAYILTVQEAGSVIGSVASFVSFGALVAAGWIGWQRPWLYGLVAGILGYILFATFFTYLVANDPKAAAAITTSQLATYLLTNGVVQAGIGTLAGFYGGYLRRRLADPSIRRTSSARPRR